MRTYAYTVVKSMFMLGVTICLTKPVWLTFGDITGDFIYIKVFNWILSNVELIPVMSSLIVKSGTNNWKQSNELTYYVHCEYKSWESFNITAVGNC